MRQVSVPNSQVIYAMLSSVFISLILRPRLRYSIHDVSSHSGKYIPENIMIDAPHDKSSRWSGIQQSGLSSFRQRQWITLKLDKVAVLSVHSSLSKLRG